MEAFRSLGALALGVSRYLAELVELLGRSLYALARLTSQARRVVTRVTTLQVFYTGFQSVVPLTLASVAIGVLVLSISLRYLPVDYVQGIASIVIVREVVPLVTMFLLIGRSGTAITIEVGTMKLNDELDALQIMGIPVDQYVMVPRLLGMVIAFVLLLIYGILFGLLGGYYGTALVDWNLPAYPVTDLLEGIEPKDFFVAVLKVALFGVIVALTAIQHGLQVQRSRREIPIVTSRAVVRSLLLCFIVNTAVSISLN
ncbi:MAG: ABC transporter permease [Myxococcales bacterium]|nr:ABC transporter permease [Myxococcales bacterium]